MTVIKNAQVWTLSVCVYMYMCVSVCVCVCVCVCVYFNSKKLHITVCGRLDRIHI